MNKPITILFDAGPMVNGQKSGVGYYTYQLIEALAANYPDEVELVGHYFNFLGRKRPDLPRAKNIRYRQSRLLPGKVLSLTRRLGFQLPFDFLVKTRGDIALFPNFVSLPLLHKAKKVVVVHDLCFIDRPEYLQTKNRDFLQRFVPRSVKKASLVIAVSESTKDALTHNYHLPPDKILVTPIPPPSPVKEAVTEQGHELPTKFILFLSTLEPRKNYINLVKAYTQLSPSLKRDYGLVLAGGPGWDDEEAMSTIARLREGGEKIYLTGYVDELTKAYLYQHASLFVMPSHYEGFGMPVLEAMGYGVPTAISDIPVSHEVAGAGAIYFDKDDPRSIAKSMSQILTDSTKSAELVKKGFARLELFNWEDNARLLMEAFEKLMQRPEVT